MSHIPFQMIDWNNIVKEQHPGISGTSFWQVVQFPGLRIRLVEYTNGYFADHWCQKGHIIYCLQGEFISELEDGKEYTLTTGMCYVVSDDLSSHRSRTDNGVTLLVIDGDFLKLTQ